MYLCRLLILLIKSRELDNNDSEENEDFQIIFDYLPKISFYQAAIVFLTGYCNVAAGSLQLAQIILQANPGNNHLHIITDPPTRALTRSGLPV